MTGVQTIDRLADRRLVPLPFAAATGSVAAWTSASPKRGHSRARPSFTGIRRAASVSRAWRPPSYQTFLSSTGATGCPHAARSIGWPIDPTDGPAPRPECTLHAQVAVRLAQRRSEAQLAQVAIDDVTVARLRERAGEPIPVDTSLQRRAIERDLARRASDHAARRITTEAYLAEHVRLNAELDALGGPSGTLVGNQRRRHDRPVPAGPKGVVGRGGEWERAKLVASVYDRIVVNDREVVEVELTDDAKRHGLAWALPEQVVVVLARPAGLEPTTFCSGGRRSIR